MICQRVIIIHEGEIVAMDTPQALAERLQGAERIQLEVAGPMGQVVRTLRAIPGVQDVTFTDLGDRRSAYSVISRRGDEMRANLAKAVVEQGWGLLRLETVSMSLEEIFLRLTTTEEA